MKLVFILVLSLFCSLTGCEKSTAEFINVNNLSELTHLITSKEDIIVEIAKYDCYYCQQLNDLEKRLSNKVIIYKYVVDEDSDDKDIKYLKSVLKPLDYVPTFYFINQGEINDYLVISNWENPINELDNWIEKLKKD